METLTRKVMIEKNFELVYNKEYEHTKIMSWKGRYISPVQRDDEFKQLTSYQKFILRQQEIIHNLK